MIRPGFNKVPVDLENPSHFRNSESHFVAGHNQTCEIYLRLCIIPEPFAQITIAGIRKHRHAPLGASSRGPFP